MKVIIAGGRDYRLTRADYDWLDRWHARCPIAEVVSGCARGADRDGEAWAGEHGIPVRQFPADWDGKPRVAGVIRNGDMARYADALIAFPGGSGTEDMWQKAGAHGLLRVRGGEDAPTASHAVGTLL